MSDIDRILADAAPQRGVTEDLVASRLRNAVLGAAAGPVPSQGRYTLLERLGQGGMGSVWAAWDAKLDRKVALKFLRSGEDGRLLTEAQAIARLSDPHVVAVFDVAQWNPPHDPTREHVVLAMEFLGGQTLGAWLRAESRGWPAIVAMFVQAGRGLQAAHRAAVVHRDFKPDNVIISAGPGGERATVVDFGIAHVQANASTDLFAGTPPYMPPEQHRGRPVDARADQYAWCVALWEALFGERPFRGDDTAALLRDKLEHAPRPGSANAPAWIRRVLERGLAPDPEARWPDMDAVLRELDRDPARRRRRIVGAVVLTGGIAAAALMWPRADPCDDGATSIAEVWNEDRAGAIERAFAALELPYAGTTWATTRVAIDHWTASWATARNDACAAHRGRQQSDELFDRRMSCLATRRDRLRALLDVLEHADATAVDRAVTAAQRLPAVDRCSDVVALRRVVALPDDPADAAHIEAITRTLADARAAIDAGHFDEGLSHADAAIADYQQRGIVHDATLGEAEMLRGDALGWLGNSEEAREALLRAAAAALQAGDDETFGHAAAGMVWELGDFARDFTGAAQWSALGEAALARAQRPPALAYLLGNAIATVDLDAEHLDRARTRFEHELVAVERHFGAQDHRAFVLRTNLASTLLRAGLREASRDEYQKAIDIGIATLGREHPRVLLARANLVGALQQLGRDRQAIAEIDQVIEAQRRTVGEMHPDYATSLVWRAGLSISFEDPGRALADCNAAEPVITAMRADTHLAANLYYTRARALVDLERIDEADRDAQAAVRIMKALYSETNSDQVYIEQIVGKIAMARGEPVAATRIFEGMLDLVEKTAGDSMRRGNTLLLLSGSLRAEGRIHESLTFGLLAIAELTAVGAPSQRTLVDAYEELATTSTTLASKDQVARLLAVAASTLRAFDLAQ